MFTDYYFPSEFFTPDYFPSDEEATTTTGEPLIVRYYDLESESSRVANNPNNYEIHVVGSRVINNPGETYVDL